MKSTFPIIQSVLEGNTLGKVINLSPQDTLIFHSSGFAELLLTCEMDQIDWVALLGQNVLPQYFHLYDFQPGLIDSILHSSPNWNLLLRKRLKGIHDCEIIPRSLPEQYVMIDARDITEADFNKIPQALYQKFYPDIKSFKEHSWAKILFNQDFEFCAICYAAAWGNATAEIDVYTESQLRGKGFAELVVNAFISELRLHGRCANWDCFLDNFGSVTLAKKCGFNLKQEYWMLSVYKIDEEV